MLPVSTILKLEANVKGYNVCHMIVSYPFLMQKFPVRPLPRDSEITEKTRS